MTPVFAHGQLRLYLLSLLAERPMHGYEVIQELGDRFGGTYIPSAGTIYPRLAKLQAEGLISNEADGRKTIYTSAVAGRADVRARQGELDSIEDDVTGSVRHLADQVRAGVTDAMKSLRADLAAAARESTQDARQARPVPRTSEALDSRRQLQEAELVINEFRHELRAELRTRAARGELPDGTADLLKQRLDAVKASLRVG